MKQICVDVEEQQAAGAALARCLVEPVTILLSGDLGVGKTTFVQGVIKALAFSGSVKSPTFTLVETYPTTPIGVTHFDWYRIEHPKELENIGIWDYFDEPSHHFIEWPEKAPEYTEHADLRILFQHNDKTRALEAEALTDKGKQILNKWLKQI